METLIPVDPLPIEIVGPEPLPLAEGRDLDMTFSTADGNGGDAAGVGLHSDGDSDGRPEMTRMLPRVGLGPLPWDGAVGVAF